MPELFLSDLEGRFADADLPTYVGHWCAGLDLAQDVGDLLLAELALSISAPPAGRGVIPRICVPLAATVVVLWAEVKLVQPAGMYGHGGRRRERLSEM